MKGEWKLVPVEPTKEMVEAGFDAVPGAFEGLISARWRCMLRAAPQPPSQWPAPRPMSEATRDKTVLAWWPRQQQWAETTWLYFCNKWTCDFATNSSPQPTHWLPMPPKPTEQETTK